MIQGYCLSVEVKRAFRYRFYPTPEQEDSLAKTFGCARFAYNYMLRLRTDAWLNDHKSIGYHETSALLTRLKRTPEHLWLNEVSSVPVQQALQHLQSAFNNFFAKRARYPTFKSKHGKQATSYVATGFQWNGKEELKLAKMDAPLDIRWSRPLPKGAKVTTCTVSKDAAERYFVSMLCDVAVNNKHKVASKVGIDLGLTHFAILSTGEKIGSPKTFRKYESRLAKLQRRLAKKKLGSKNRAKAKLKVARLHARIADSRKDFLHKLSTRLINENQVIAVETLAVSNMQKNHSLAKSITDAGWAEFLRQLEYKATWYGRTLAGIDKWFPSTKRCNECGHTLKSLSLKVREWTCPECYAVHDRDVNAAKNVLTAGLAGLALGENVSPLTL
jgi:putative transposase